MSGNDPIAHFITWSTYGTHLQGDDRGWRKRCQGVQPPQPRLERWRRNSLKFDVVVLSPEQRINVQDSCRRHCDHRGWTLWVANARSNHVHVVVTAVSVSGKTIRDQLKANCTRGLREVWRSYRDRPVWTEGGDWECVNNEADLETVCLYVREAQDRMGSKPQ